VVFSVNVLKRSNVTLKLPSFGLRAGILSQLVFLIVAAMLLVNVAMLNFSERDLVQAKVDSGHLIIRVIEQYIKYEIENGDRLLYELSSDTEFRKDLERLLTDGDYPNLVILDNNGVPVFTSGLPEESMQSSITLAREAMGTMTESVNYSGTTWGVLWHGKKEVHISAPLLLNGKLLGGIAINSSLDKIYDVLRDTEKLILFYIILDTVILAIVGIYLLSRIVVKPIYRLLKMTEEYKVGDIVPSVVEDSRNEIGNLSRSLGNMLQRLDENKKELKAHISSLEEANMNLKQAQKEIIRSEKLASVGRLAAGVAHEIGNPVGIILGYLELIRKDDIKDEEKRGFLDRVESEVTRVNRIINQLLDFSRPSSGKKEEVNVHDLILDTVKMLKPQSMMDEIVINTDFRASNDKVLADPNQLKQVFLNILMNAADALSLEGPSRSGESRELAIESSNPGDLIELKFKDNGQGMAQEDIDHIFDPFYTTKPPGKGTGLGLSVCYRIIEEEGGAIRAESAPGEGMTIIIEFPLCK
jgi:signal transduction histidine kinase